MLFLQHHILLLLHEYVFIYMLVILHCNAVLATSYFLHEYVFIHMLVKLYCNAVLVTSSSQP